MSANTIYRGQAAIDFAASHRDAWIKVRDPAHKVGYRFLSLADALRWPTPYDVTAGTRRRRRTESQRLREMRARNEARVPELRQAQANACHCGAPHVGEIRNVGKLCGVHLREWANATEDRDAARLDAMEGRR